MREHGTSADLIADGWQLLGHDASGGRRCHDGHAARHRMKHRGHTERRPQVGVLNRRGRELVRPLLFLQVRDRPRHRLLAVGRLGVGGRFVSEHVNRSEIVPVGKPRCVQHEGPAIAAGGRRRAFDAERARPGGWDRERGRLSVVFRREFNARLTRCHRLEVGERCEMHREECRVIRHERRVSMYSSEDSSYTRSVRPTVIVTFTGGWAFVRRAASTPALLPPAMAAR